MTRHVFRFAAFLLAALAAVLTSFAAAQAAPVAVPAAPVAVPAPAAVSDLLAASARAASAPAAARITCTLAVHTPHDSGHVGGTVNVTGDITCRNAAGVRTNVASLSLRIQLYKKVCDPTCSWVAYGKPGSKTVYGKYTVSANSAGPCTVGTYEGAAAGRVVFPPGYTPSSGTVSKVGPAAKVDCR